MRKTFSVPPGLIAALGVVIMLGCAAPPAPALLQKLTPKEFEAIRQLGAGKNKPFYLEYMKKYQIEHHFDPFERLIIFTPFLDLLGSYLQTQKPDGSLEQQIIDQYSHIERFFIQVDTVGYSRDFHKEYKPILRQGAEVIQPVRVLRTPMRLTKLGEGYPPFRGIFLLYYRIKDIDFSKPATLKVLRNDDKPTVYEIDWSKYK